MLKYYYRSIWWLFNTYKNRVIKKIKYNADFYDDSYRPLYGNYRISPNDIGFIHSQKGNNLKKIDRGLILGGDWDSIKPSQRFENSRFYISAKERFFGKKLWSDTEYYNHRSNENYKEEIGQVVRRLDKLFLSALLSFLF